MWGRRDGVQWRRVGDVCGVGGSGSGGVLGMGGVGGTVCGGEDGCGAEGTVCGGAEGWMESVGMGVE